MSIRVYGEVATHIDSAATGHEALAYARSLIDARIRPQAIHPPDRPIEHD